MNRPDLHFSRRTVQIGVALAFIVIPWLNHLRISVVYGNFLSFHFYKVPLSDPLAVLQVSLKNNYLSADLLLGAAIALGLAAALGAVFCSWICPFGLLSEWAHALSGTSGNRRAKRPARPGPWGFRIKSMLCATGLAVFFLFSTTPVLNQFSLPAWYSRIFQFWFEQRHFCLAIPALAAILFIEALAGRRLWCRCICPQSVLIVLVRQINPRRLRIHFNGRQCACKGGSPVPCARACSLNLDPRKLNIFPETECTNCGDCVVACRERGRALALRFSRTKPSLKDGDD